MAQDLQGLTINTVKLADLDGKLIHLKQVNATGTTYTLANDILLNTFKVVGDAVYDFTYPEDGKGDLQVSATPVVKLDTTNKKVEYLASRFVESPYVQFNDAVHKDSYVGEPAVALLQGLKLYLQSFAVFAFDAYLVSEAELVADIDTKASDNQSDDNSGNASSTAPTSAAPAESQAASSEG